VDQEDNQNNEVVERAFPEPHVSVPPPSWPATVTHLVAVGGGDDDGGGGGDGFSPTDQQPTGTRLLGHVMSIVAVTWTRDGTMDTTTPVVSTVAAPGITAAETLVTPMVSSPEGQDGWNDDFE